MELLTNINVFLVLLLLALKNEHRYDSDLKECIYSIDELKRFQIFFT